METESRYLSVTRLEVDYFNQVVGRSKVQEPTYAELVRQLKQSLGYLDETALSRHRDALQAFYDYRATLVQV